MKTHEELIEKYKNLNLKEELRLVMEYTRSGYITKEYAEYYSWLALAALNKIKELEQKGD